MGVCIGKGALWSVVLGQCVLEMVLVLVCLFLAGIRNQLPLGLRRILWFVLCYLGGRWPGKIGAELVRNQDPVGATRHLAWDILGWWLYHCIANQWTLPPFPGISLPALSLG